MAQTLQLRLLYFNFWIEFLCYTFNVEQKYKLWRIWSRALQRWGMQEWAASLLEASGPLNLVLAQFVYIGQPVFQSIFDRGHIGILADTLEDGAETQAFIDLLREGLSS